MTLAEELTNEVLNNRDHEGWQESIGWAINTTLERAAQVCYEAGEEHTHKSEQDAKVCHREDARRIRTLMQAKDGAK